MSSAQTPDHPCDADDDPQNPHEGEVSQVNGYWLCWKHHQQFNTDGVTIKGIVRKSEEGDNPWYNQI